MSARALPPDDISPLEFFTRWVPEAVANDERRRLRLGRTRATIVFEVSGEIFSLRLPGDGRIEGSPGESVPVDLRVRVDVATWRMLNRGDLSAPEAVLRRRVRLEGDLLLGLKLHLILGV